MLAGRFTDSKIIRNGDKNAAPHTGHLLPKWGLQPIQVSRGFIPNPDSNRVFKDKHSGPRTDLDLRPTGTQPTAHLLAHNV